MQGGSGVTLGAWTPPEDLGSGGQATQGGNKPWATSLWLWSLSWGWDPSHWSGDELEALGPGEQVLSCALPGLPGSRAGLACSGCVLPLPSPALTIPCLHLALPCLCPAWICLCPAFSGRVLLASCRCSGSVWPFLAWIWLCLACVLPSLPMSCPFLPSLPVPCLYLATCPRLCPIPGSSCPAQPGPERAGGTRGSPGGAAAHRAGAGAGAGPGEGRSGSALLGLAESQAAAGGGGSRSSETAAAPAPAPAPGACPALPRSRRGGTARNGSGRPG